MGKVKAEKEDPTWNRNNRHAKKKHKMCSRGALKMLRSLVRKKRAADKGRDDKTVCVTRTVELLPTSQSVGDERNKLLFMIALGLTPLPGFVKNRQLPIVMLKRMDPLLEAQAATKTTERMFQLFQSRNIAYHVRATPAKDVEIVNLVSDDDSPCTTDDSGSDSDSVVPDEDNQLPLAASAANQNHRCRPVSTKTSNSILSPSSWYPAVENYRISKSMQPVFKPIVNNQDGSSGIFSNWKPESMTRLMNLSNSNAETSPAGKTSKLLTALKSVPLNPSLDFRDFTSKAYNGAACMNQVHRVRTETSSTVPEYLGPEPLVTID